MASVSFELYGNVQPLYDIAVCVRLFTAVC